ncbi:hypothetical protein V2J09_004298 [Rumex salicifolius]
MPVLHKRMSKVTCQGIIDKINAKLTSWQSKTLSFVGKLTLLRFAKNIDNITRGFLWDNTTQRCKMHLDAWDRVCRPKRIGGLGVRKMADVNIAIMRFLESTNENWANILFLKHIRRASAGNQNPSYVWNNLKKATTAVGRAGHLGMALEEEVTQPLRDDKANALVRAYWIADVGWNWDAIVLHMPAHAKLKLATIMIDTSLDLLDTLSWLPTPNGEFSMSWSTMLTTPCLVKSGKSECRSEF